jgi:hypothetical protein
MNSRLAYASGYDDSQSRSREMLKTQNPPRAFAPGGFSLGLAID